MAPADGGVAAAKRMLDRAARLKNLAPVLKVFAEEIHRATDDAFDQSRNVLGQPFPKLASSTLNARGSKVRGGKRKTKGGRLTPGALNARLKASGSHKPLIDTGRARNSQRAQVKGNSIRWSAVGYLEPHMRGKKLPKRNPTVFAVPSSGKPALHVPFARRLSSLVTRYVDTGKVA